MEASRLPPIRVVLASARSKTRLTVLVARPITPRPQVSTTGPRRTIKLAQRVCFDPTRRQPSFALKVRAPARLRGPLTGYTKVRTGPLSTYGQSPLRFQTAKSAPLSVIRAGPQGHPTLPETRTLPTAPPTLVLIARLPPSVGSSPAFASTKAVTISLGRVVRLPPLPPSLRKVRSKLVRLKTRLTVALIRLNPRPSLQAHHILDGLRATSVP